MAKIGRTVVVVVKEDIGMEDDNDMAVEVIVDQGAKKFLKVGCLEAWL
jgi:replication-associated recombination protein RarA